MRKTVEQGWGRNVLGLMIENHAHERQGKAVTNFPKTLHPRLSVCYSPFLSVIPSRVSFFI